MVVPINVDVPATRGEVERYREEPTHGAEATSGGAAASPEEPQVAAPSIPRSDKYSGGGVPPEEVHPPQNPRRRWKKNKGASFGDMEFCVGSANDYYDSGNEGSDWDLELELDYEEL